MKASQSLGLARRPAVYGAALLLACAFSAESATPPRRVSIEGVPDKASNLKLSDFEGRDLTAELKPEQDGTRVTVALTRLDQFVVKPRDIRTVVPAERGKTVLPGGVVVPLVAAPDESTEARSAWFRLTYEASPSPVPWDADGRGYVTRLTFGLLRPPSMPEGIALERPVLVKLGFDGFTASDVPVLAIEAPGLENEKTVELRFQPRTPKPTVLVRSTISDVNLELRVLDRLELRPQVREVLGFGLESVEVVVENVRAHGEPQPVERVTAIAVESDGRARPEAAELAFAAGASRAAFRVRSSGLGPVTLTATANGLSGRTVIEQRFPAGPVIATVLGAALGGYARRFVKGARKKQAARRVGEGVVVGIVAFVAGVLGVGYLNLPPALVATEAGAFLVGAIAGFAGVTVFEVLAKKNAAAA